MTALCGACADQQCRDCTGHLAPWPDDDWCTCDHQDADDRDPEPWTTDPAPIHAHPPGALT